MVSNCTTILWSSSNVSWYFSMRCWQLRRRWCSEWRTCSRGSQRQRIGLGVCQQSTTRKPNSYHDQLFSQRTLSLIFLKSTKRKICSVSKKSFVYNTFVIGIFLQLYCYNFRKCYTFIFSSSLLILPFYS